MAIKRFVSRFKSQDGGIIYLCVSGRECWFEDEYSQIDIFDIKIIEWAAIKIKSMK